MTDTTSRPRRRVRTTTASATAAPSEPVTLAGKATINDIAPLTGVSKKAVSRGIHVPSSMLRETEWLSM